MPPFSATNRHARKLHEPFLAGVAVHVCEIRSAFGIVDFEILAQDPRPQYQDDPERIYGLLFEGRNIKFKVADGVLTVVAVEQTT